MRAGTTGASDAQVPARTAFRLHQNNQNTVRREEVIEVVEHRKSLEDDCPICQEPLASTPLADLVWCKAQCGTNFHRECWAEWESSQLGSTSTGLPTLRCAFCRTSWPTPCHHDTSTPPAVPPIQPEPAADAAAAAADDDDTFFPPSFFDPRSHAWSLWSTPSAATTTTTTSTTTSSSSPDHSSPLAALFDPVRHTRPLLRDRRARADVFFALPAAAAAAADDNDDDGDGEARGDGDEEGDGEGQQNDDIAASLAALFNPRVHRRAQVFCGWEAAENEEDGGGGSGAGFDVLFDAKRHGRALRNERLARAAVLDADDDGDEGGVLGALFEEECEVEPPEKEHGGKGRELQMVYVTLVDDPGKEEERDGGEEEEEQEEPTGLCERVAWWVCGRKWL
ncbi:hypothetical protein DIS24_g9211 [Lasiodiplodia hormozganensis]|uniref:RING-type domain-containing protein n=1 Tax=Lasiodiplodia hormozganensis TaxID=869390 RepID=A0AA39XXW9_9PEZI|nr:hypothetical protein DIS24_g9211 [Lasiodiplodia hormozganensis]